jgi:hypothetical protein
MGCAETNVISGGHTQRSGTVCAIETSYRSILLSRSWEKFEGLPPSHRRCSRSTNHGWIQSAVHIHHRRHSKSGTSKRPAAASDMASFWISPTEPSDIFCHSTALQMVFKCDKHATHNERQALHCFTFSLELACKCNPLRGNPELYNASSSCTSIQPTVGRDAVLRAWPAHVTLGMKLPSGSCAFVLALGTRSRPRLCTRHRFSPEPSGCVALCRGRRVLSVDRSGGKREGTRVSFRFRKQPHGGIR